MPDMRPNIIVFLTDQQRWDTSGLHGCPLDLTPNFDAAARRGVHLAQCISSQPVCAPARACLQTGTYATTHGVWSNAQSLAAEQVTLAKLFQAAGYHTGYIGKWHLNGTPRGPAQAVPRERRLGYQSWLAANVFEFCSQPYDCILFDENDQPVSLPGYRADAVVDAAIRFVDRHRHEPFFLFVSLIEPHHQNEHFDYVPPRGYRERFTGRWLPPDLASLPGNGARHAGGYFGCVKRCDEAFGRLLDALASTGLESRTNVLYTADHGCHFGTRPGVDKRSCHDSSVRVPGALIGPDFDGGGQLDQPVSLVDLPPTLLRAAGLAVPAHFQGRALQELLRRPVRERQPSTALIQTTEEVTPHLGRALRSTEWKYGVTSIAGSELPNGSATAYRESDFYDLRHDPYELCNLVRDQAHEARRRQFREALLSRLASIGEAPATIAPAEALTGKTVWRY